MYIYKHCFLPMLLVFATKCCTKMPCPLPHNHYCCLLPSPVCLPHLLIYTCLISSLIACPPSSVLCWCLLCSLLFLLYATFLCDSIFACLCTYFLFCFYFCAIPCDCYNFVLSPSLWFFHAICVSDLISLPQIFDGVVMMKHVCVFVILAGIDKDPV